MHSLDDIYQQVQNRQSFPVQKWQPALSGLIDINIDQNGVWRHEGQVIARRGLVELFAAILRCEQDCYFLVTPVEKWQIEVADVPFVIEFAREVNEGWEVQTNVGDRFVVGSDHLVELRPYAGQLIPYVNVRFDLWARVSRSVYVQWVNAALERLPSAETLCLTSGAYTFKVADADFAHHEEA